MMSGDFFYKIFYFCLFFYAISTCVRNCLNEDEPPPQEEQAVDNDNNNGGDNDRDLDINERAERRRELVLGRLEYRKILAPSSRSNAEQKSSENKKKKNENTNELDLEKGEGIVSSNKGKDKDKDTETETKKTVDNDSSVRSFIGFGLPSISMFNLVGGGTSSRNEEDYCCSICLDPYAPGDTVARLKTDSNNKDSCNHWFHEDCILQWLQNHDDCPLCRKNMIDI